MNETEVTCPYCKEDFEVETGDGAHYEDGKSEEETCPNCDKRMMIYSSCTWSREAEAADCLNTDNHPWSDWRTLWMGEKEGNLGKFYERRYCNDCGADETVWHDTRLDLRPSERFDTKAKRLTNEPQTSKKASA